MKKLLSMMLALVMVIALAVPAFAANTENNKITIKQSENGHIYEAYQIFKGKESNEVT